MDETWKAIPGYEGLYEVSDQGRVRRVVRSRGYQVGRLLTPKHHARGYRSVILHKDKKPKTMLVHRLVLCAFIGPCPEGMETCHNNGVRADNRLENLRWDTTLANAADRERHGTHAKGEKTGKTPLTEADVVEIRNLRGMGMKAREIAYRFGIAEETVYGITLRKRWAHVK